VLQPVTELLDAAKFEAGAPGASSISGNLDGWPREWVSLFGGGEDPGGGTVLVCEGNTRLRTFLVDLLGERYKVVTAADGAGGLERIKQDPPDVTVTDVRMAIMGGEQLIAEIQRDTNLAGLPVLVLGARADKPLREKLSSL
jgi:CheY-like chemotaxis protein